MALLLGYDIGSSSIKAALIDSDTHKLVASASSPQTEMEIISPQPGWAEQNPETWWEQVINATNILKTRTNRDLRDVAAIGISYQMHGLVVVDKNHLPLRNSIIWCDSRAVEAGDRATGIIGEESCLEKYCNFIGNFTASKLGWIKQNEPDTFRKIHKAMLPGDYIAMKLTGLIRTTRSGLSEGILWDCTAESLADPVLDALKIPRDYIADLIDTFSVQGEVSKEAAGILGLSPGTKVSYRAGDQPNNALSLNVLNPGEIATTAGTSGVIYAVHGTPIYDKHSRVNTFVHVNHKKGMPRYGVLMCVNGTGILNRWVRYNLTGSSGNELSYNEMNKLASTAPPGCDGLMILPYGNGAERTLLNKNIEASIHGLNFNIHRREHFFLAAQEGIVFALNYGLEIMREMGLEIKAAKAGNSNMFLSPLFREIFANVTGCGLELFDTDGAQGAARGAGIGCGVYSDFDEAFRGLELIKKISPEKYLSEQYISIYSRWKGLLDSRL